MMIISAWIMGLVISTPMYIDQPGFSNFTREINITDEIYNSTSGPINKVNCMPPVLEDSFGFVLYAGMLAFVIPSIILGGLQFSILYHLRLRQRNKIKR